MQPVEVEDREDARALRQRAQLTASVGAGLMGIWASAIILVRHHIAHSNLRR